MEQYFASVPAKDIVSDDSHPIVSVSPNDTVESVLKKLSSHNIYAVPVVDNGKTLGLVDLVDLLTHLVHIFAHTINAKLGGKRDTVTKFVEHHYTAQELDNVKNTFFNGTAAKIIDHSKQNGYHPVKVEGATLKDIVKALALPNVHRIVLTNAHDHPVKIVSQSTVIHYLSKHVEKLGKLGEQSLEEAKCVTRNLITITPEMRAIDAFVTITEHHLSALAYLGEDGTIGNVSVKDLKGVLINFNNLTLPVVEYVNIIRRDTVKDIPPLVSIQTSESVSKAIQKLSAVGIHRLYILSGKGHTPEGTVALGDILKLLRHGWA